MFGDKDIKGTITPLIDIIDQWHISILNHQRAATIDQLNNVFHELNIKIYYPHQFL